VVHEACTIAGPYTPVTRRRAPPPRDVADAIRPSTVVLPGGPDGNAVPISIPAQVDAAAIRSWIGGAPRDSFVIRHGYAISRM